jgi:hypothetical protein
MKLQFKEKAGKISTFSTCLVKSANRQIKHIEAQTHHSDGLTHALLKGRQVSSKLANPRGGTCGETPGCGGGLFQK